MTTSLLRKLLRGAPALALVCVASAAHGQTTVWSDDFDNRVDGDGPMLTAVRNIDYTSDSMLDWLVAGNSGTTTEALIENTATDGKLRFNDGGSTGLTTTVPIAQMAAIGAGATITIQFDAKVESYIGGANSVFRVILFDDGTGTNNQKFTLGFSRVDRDGDTFDENQWYALGGPSAASPTTANSLGIGFNGSSWDSGFAFSDYNSGDAASNTSSDYFRFVISFTDGTADYSIAATNLGSAETASVSGSFSSALTWSDANASDLLRVSSGGSGTGQFLVDNISVTATASATPPSLSITEVGGSLLVEYAGGTLQEAGDLSGWTDVDPQPASPFTLTLSPGEKRFFQVVEVAP